MEKLFSDLERLLEIETLLADHETACRELESDVDYEKDELRYAKVQLLSLDSPNFFQKLMPAKLENQRELARAKVRSHTAALEEAKWALEAKRYSLAQLKEEYQKLLPRRKEYEAGKGSFPAELEQHLVCFEAIQVAERVLFFLGEAKKWFRGNSSSAIHLEGSRQLEFLSKAAQDAHLLRSLLEKLPSPIELRYSYLSWPEHYVTEPTSHYDQMDRLNMALDLIRDIRRQLRELL